MLRAADMAEVSGFIQDLKDGSGRCGFDAHVRARCEIEWRSATKNRDC